MVSFLVLVAGLILLIVGGDALVRGATGLAERLRIPPMVIGLTVVAFGTSAPEMFVSVGAALNNAGGIAIGNVVGSNIANAMLVLSAPALIAATNCSEKGVGRNLVVMIAVTLVFMVMLASGNIARIDGLFLLVLLALFVHDQYRTAMKARRASVDDALIEALKSAPHSTPAIIGFLVGGLLLLPLGAKFTVDGATAIAASLGISDAVIGLTVVAIGTSLPEIATSLLAVWRGNHSVAVGNVVGSNIFNIAAIMGVTATIIPVPVAERVVQFDMWMMLLSSLLVAALAVLGVRIGRRMGAAMVCIYIAYAALSFAF